MALSFKPLKLTGLPKASAKLSAVGKAPKISKPSLAKVKVPATKSFKDFNFAKFSKVKIPKVAKVKALKRAIKKNVGY